MVALRWAQGRQSARPPKMHHVPAPHISHDANAWTARGPRPGMVSGQGWLYEGRHPLLAEPSPDGEAGGEAGDVGDVVGERVENSLVKQVTTPFPPKRETEEEDRRAVRRLTAGSPER